jgi:hypothetical protein
MLLSHPAIVDSALTRETWTALDVSAAFDDVLRARMQPCGQLTYMDSRITEPELTEFAGVSQ